jgi:phosphoserine phosphatase RsbU/P
MEKLSGMPSEKDAVSGQWWRSRQLPYGAARPAMNPASRHPVDALVAILELSRDIGLWADLPTLLARIETTALMVLGCERLAVFTGDSGANELRSQLATGTSEIRLPPDRGIASATYRDGIVLNVHDVSVDPRFYDQVDRRTGYRTRSLLSVPLHDVTGEITGVIEFLNKKAGAFTKSDEELARTFAALTEITLQRQVLLEQYHEKQRLLHELELARRIQRSLLPAADPQLRGYDIAGWSDAAAATGGDFHDHFELPDGRLALVVADVAGHGMAASLLACETRALIRSAASSAKTLVEIAASTNDLLYRDLQHERFVVLFLAALDAGSGRLEFVAAGCAPIVHRTDSDPGFVPVEATTIPLGILPALPASTATAVTLCAGDVVVMATDGFYERENPAGALYGLDLLHRRIHEHSERSSAELIQSLHHDVSAYAEGARQTDDMTAIVLRRL